MTNTQAVTGNGRAWNGTSPGSVLAEADEDGLIEEISDQVGKRLADEEAERESEGLAPHDPAKVAQLRSKYILSEIREYGKRRTGVGTPALSAEQELRVVQSVDARLNGLGMLQALLEDPDTTDVTINGHDEIFINRVNGSKEKLRGRKVAPSDDELIRMMNAKAQEQGKTWNRSEPELSLALTSPTGRVDRLTGLAFVTTRPSVTIRRPNFGIFCLQHLVRLGTVDQVMANLLRTLVLAKKNILVSGGTGAGKTTLLRCLMNEIPGIERIVTIEDPVELGLSYFIDLHPDQVETTARRANAVGKGEFTLRELQRAGLRLSPDRVILGEIRGPAAYEMVNAMTQGNDGSMCTIHADSTESALQRLQMYLLEAPEQFTHQAVTMMGTEAVDFVVHVERLDDGRRVVTGLNQITKETGSEFIKSDCIYRMGEVSKLPAATGPNAVTIEDLQRGAAAQNDVEKAIAGSEKLLAAHHQNTVRPGQ